MEELNIELDKTIDPDALDVEWINQQNLFYKYSNALNEEISVRNSLKVEVDECKHELDKVSAQVDLLVRERPEDFDVAKITEKAVANAVLLSEDYQEASEMYFDKRRQLNEAQDRVNFLYTCVGTMNEKKSAMEELVKLLNQEYFAAPMEPRNLSEEYHKKVQKHKKGAKNKIKKRNKKE